MQSNGSVRLLRTGLASALALAALALGACSATSQEDLDQVELRQDNDPAPTCSDQFECDCKKVGGTVDGPGWCCKHYGDGSKQCTNMPEKIIWWLTASSGSTKSDLSDPEYAAIYEALMKQVEDSKGEVPAFDPNMSGFPGHASEKERFDAHGCHAFCGKLEQACKDVVCGPDAASCEIRCMRLGQACDGVCTDMLIASEYPP
jgi:hypothetical protein